MWFQESHCQVESATHGDTVDSGYVGIRRAAPRAQQFGGLDCEFTLSFLVFFPFPLFPLVYPSSSPSDPPISSPSSLPLIFHSFSSHLLYLLFSDIVLFSSMLCPTPSSHSPLSSPSSFSPHLLSPHFSFSPFFLFPFPHLPNPLDSKVHIRVLHSCRCEQMIGQ